MADFQYCFPNDELDLEQILTLQRTNLEEILAPSDVRDQGFVTVRHDLSLLRDMNRSAPQVIAKKDGLVVGYALMMLPAFQDRIPVLKPMFAMLDRQEYRGRPLSDYRYFVMGQICVARACRGQGVFDGMYRFMRACYASQYDFVITEVATRNGRSLAAHRRVGFKLLLNYQDEIEDWDIVVWDWRE